MGVGLCYAFNAVDLAQYQLGERILIGDVGDDRMRRGQLILLVRPRLAAVRERRPRVGEARGRHGGVRPHVVGERLLEPQVVPPSHRREVAEPHVRHLVEDRVRARLALTAHRAPMDHIRNF